MKDCRVVLERIDIKGLNKVPNNSVQMEDEFMSAVEDTSSDFNSAINAV